MTLSLPRCKTEFFRKSFFFNTAKLWNRLTVDLKQSQSLNIFLKCITNKKPKNLLYYHGTRFCTVHHCRLRLGCSRLNSDLCNNLLVKHSAKCICGNNCEDVTYYFFHCPLFAVQREILMEKIDFVTDVKTEILLFGDESIAYEDNIIIFTSVHEYIKTSHRFD